MSGFLDVLARIGSAVRDYKAATGAEPYAVIVSTAAMEMLAAPIPVKATTLSLCFTGEPVKIEARATCPFETAYLFNREDYDRFLTTEGD